VGCHPPPQFRSGPVRIDAADIVFPLPRPTVVPFVVPEVEVPPSLEVTNPRPASDFHFIPLSRGILSVSMSLSGGGVRNNSPHPEVQIQGRDASLGTERSRMTDAVIVGAVRTPMGRHRGILKDVRPDDLAALVVGEVVRRAGLDPALVEEVYLGCANQAGEDNRNVARMAALLAGLPVSVAGVTFNRLCASGLAAINAEARAIKADEGDVFVAGRGRGRGRGSSRKRSSRCLCLLRRGRRARYRGTSRLGPTRPWRRSRSSAPRSARAGRSRQAIRAGSTTGPRRSS